MTIKPLCGQVLVELLPPERQSAGGIDLPDHTLSPEEHQEAARRPTMPPGNICTVVACGAWPKTKSGLLRMPEFGRGARVVINPNRGVEMQTLGKQFRMVDQNDVLAVLTT